MLSFVWMEKAQNLLIVNGNVVLTLLNLQGVEFLGLYKPLIPLVLPALLSNR